MDENGTRIIVADDVSPSLNFTSVEVDLTIDISECNFNLDECDHAFEQLYHSINDSIGSKVTLFYSKNSINFFHSGTVFSPHFLRCGYLPVGLPSNIFSYIRNYRNRLYHRRNLHYRSSSTSSEKKNTTSRS